MVVITEYIEPDSIDPIEEAKLAKEEGNKHFKETNYEEAIKCYSKAIKLNPETKNETAIYYKNRAACYLKIENYEKAAKDSSAALDRTPNDPKAIFRRIQAFEGMERWEDAYKDAVTLMRVDAKNPVLQPLLARLTPIVHKRAEEQARTDNKVSQMFDIGFKNKNDDLEKRVSAVNNLIVLAREEAGAKKIFETGGVPELIQLIESPEKELQLSSIRALSEICKNSRQRSLNVYDLITLQRIMKIISFDDEEVSTAMTNILQNILISISDIENIRIERDKYEAYRKSDLNNKERPFPWIAEKIEPEVKPTIDRIFDSMMANLNNKKVSGIGRDNIIELIIKLVSHKDGCGQTKEALKNNGVKNLLEVAGTVLEHKTLQITENTRMHCSLAMAKIFDDYISDKERDAFNEIADEYFTEMFGDSIDESKLEAIMCIAALLQGPFEVGSKCLSRTGVLEIILAMADSSNAMHVRYAVEALVHSASKKARCAGVIKQATPILKQLYNSTDEHIKVRALVGLAKMGSFAGSDVSAKTFAEGSEQILAKACRKFLRNPLKDVDLRKWAAEGLAYLSLDVHVKDELLEDTDAVMSLIDLAKVKDKGILYPSCQIFVNVMNSYDTKKPEAELIELAKFAKHHVPEEHEKDQEPYISERVNKLVKLGLVNALVAFSSTDSDSSKELIARCFLSICTVQENRGLVVQQGGAKVLIPLATTGTKDGKFKAANAIAKIAITMNPTVAFPGQRVNEIIRPIAELLDYEAHAILNFEALMALTNLASLNDTIRKKIIKEGVFGKVEHYIYEEHEQLKRAALECYCNITMCEEALKFFKGENDRVKYLLLMSADYSECDDEEACRICLATSGALAILTESREVCGRLVSCTKQWYEVVQCLAAHHMPAIQHRGVHILMNLVLSDKEIAARIVSTSLLEVLMAISMLEGEDNAKVVSCAQSALDQATEWGMIKNSEDGKKKFKATKKAKEKAEAATAKEVAIEEEAKVKPGTITEITDDDLEDTNDQNVEKLQSCTITEITDDDPFSEIS